jgi:hypothetical protein
MKFKGTIAISVQHNGVSVSPDHFLEMETINGIYEDEFGWLMHEYVRKCFPTQDEHNFWQTTDRKVDYALANPPPELKPYSFKIREVEYVMVFYP